MRRIRNRESIDQQIHGHYFLEMSISDLRCFGRKQTIKLSDKQGKPYHWTIIMGDNGVGKTCLLKSLISIAPSPKNIFGSYQNLKLYPGYLDWRENWSPARHNGEKSSLISAKITGGFGFDDLLPKSIQKLELKIGYSGFNDFLFNEEEYGKLGDFLCFAYGASRKMGQAKLSGDKYSTASISLFDDEAPLINVEEFFLQADYEAKTAKSKQSISQRDYVKKLLIDILPEVEDIRIANRKEMHRTRTVEMLTDFGWVNINDMSLGYKSLTAWIVDFTSRMFYYHNGKKDPCSQPAIVLVDEIDLHLHPKWQRKILEYLSKKFPNTQFIATAHSPLIVQAAFDSNLVLLTKNAGEIKIHNNPQVIKNWRIDQILTSDLFGLSSSRSQKTEKLLNQRRAILLKETLTPADEEEISKIESQLDNIPVAETPEYIKAMQLISEASEKLSGGYDKNK